MLSEKIELAKTKNDFKTKKRFVSFLIILCKVYIMQPLLSRQKKKPLTGEFGKRNLFQTVGF